MIYFLIPVYNEVKNLPRLLKDAAEYMSQNDLDFRFIFVNDGSADGSLEFLEEEKKKDSRIHILSHYPNKGVKDTFMEGFNEFLKIAKEGDILVSKEADNTSDNQVLKEMLGLIMDKGCDIALASCYAPGGGFEDTTFFRKIMSSTANLMVKLRFGLWGFYTFSSFYRAFTYECLKKAFAEEPEMMSFNGFTCVVEMLVKLNRMGFKIVEIPMILRSSERLGKSKIPVFRTILGYLKLFISRV
jgi:dolichol-phosphate mannosyltransferase